MGVYKKAIITEAGEALTARAVSGEAAIQFSHTKTSAHTYPDGTNLKKLTDLQEVKQTVIPSNIQIANDTLIIIRSMFDNSKITQEYLIQNVGIYASDGETEILFAICQATAPDQMPAFNGVAPSSFIYNVQISIAQAEELSISVNTAGAATVQDVLDLERKMEEKKLDSSGGDASNTVVSVEETASSDDKYPEINGKGSMKSTLGKLYRWVNSLKTDKVDSIGGDTADTLVSAFDASSDSFPVPVAKEKARTRWGKMKKFTEDFKNWMTGVCLIGQIVNNCVTDRNDLPLSAAQGKVLMDLYTVLNTNLTMKITSGSMTEIIDSLPVGKYSGYYSSGAADTPSNYGTFEAVVMNSSTATITAVDTSSGENYTKIKTSNTWKNWEKDITNSNLNGTGSSTVSHRTNAGGGWSSAKPSIVLEGTKGADEVIILSTMTVKDGKWHIAASQKDNLLRFRYISDSGNLVSQFSLGPDKKSAVWS